MHDLRDRDELDVLFGKGGALEAALAARADGRVRFIGLTGHHDPEILLEAMGRFRFDNVLVAINPADPRRLPFIPTVVAEARRQGMGVVSMKVLSAGQLVGDGVATASELIRYAASLSDTAIIGCGSQAEVRENLAVAQSFVPMTEAEMRALERARGAPGRTLRLLQAVVGTGARVRQRRGGEKNAQPAIIHGRHRSPSG